jgi:hypothetical protein
MKRIILLSIGALSIPALVLLGCNDRSAANGYDGGISSTQPGMDSGYPRQRSASAATGMDSGYPGYASAATGMDSGAPRQRSASAATGMDAGRASAAVWDGSLTSHPPGESLAVRQ